MMSLLAPLNLLGTLYREYTDSFYQIKEIFKLLNNQPTVQEHADSQYYKYQKGLI
jgi:ABC-type transport system involved in Fe-S cluster assembly fused permease/ATPase subunit